MRRKPAPPADRCLDLYQIHWPDPEPDIEEGWSAVAELQKEGKSAGSASRTSNPPKWTAYRESPRPSPLCSAYSILSPEIESEILPYCGQHNIGLSCTRL